MATDVTIQEAVRRLVEADTSNANRISKLESQIDEICKNFEEYREEHTRSTKEELRIMSETIRTVQQETNNKLEEIDHHSNQVYAEMKSDLNEIIRKLNEVAGPTRTTVTTVKHEATNPISQTYTVEENEELSNKENDTRSLYPYKQETSFSEY
jgi:uncharacterized protein YciW